MDSTTKTYPATVSAFLRRAGLNPLPSGTPRTREGIRVSRALNGCTVIVDLDAPTAQHRLADEVEEVLTSHGYSFNRNADIFTGVAR